MPGISKKRRSAAVPPAPSRNSILRPDISMHDWLSGMISSVARLVIAHRLPVVPAFGARARLHPLLDLLLDDVGAVGRHAGLADRCDRRRSGTPFPCSRGTCRCLRSSFHRMPALPIVNTNFSAADVDEHALEHFVEVERFAGHVLEVPRQLAVVDVRARPSTPCRAPRRTTVVPRLAGIHGLACATPQ